MHGGRAGIRDADLFYWDADTGWDAEDAVIRRGADPFAGLPVPVEIRNQARVHLWYADRFGTAAPEPFGNCAQAIDAFAAPCCAVGVTVADGGPRLYAPFGLDDLFDLVVRPNPASPAPREVYETKAARWQAVWPELTVLPWDASPPR
ncbi:nucleotidyltransferase family protein [Geodermatophilus sp. SYSU D00710]